MKLGFMAFLSWVIVILILSMVARAKPANTESTSEINHTTPLKSPKSSDAQKIQAFLQKAANDVLHGLQIAKTFHFGSKGTCNKNQVKTYIPPQVKVSEKSDVRFLLRVNGGSIALEGSCKFCTEIWHKICGTAQPTILVTSFQLQSTLLKSGSGKNTAISLAHRCHFNFDFDLNLNPTDVPSIISGLFASQLRATAIAGISKSSCDSLQKAIKKLNENICTVIDC